MLAKRDSIRVLQDVVFYDLAVDAQSVHASQILDRGDVSDGHDLTVVAADVARFQLQLIVGCAADR